jgi:hypothetical protein
MDLAGYPPTMASTTDRAARVATTVVFFLTGAVIAAWSTRIPAIQERLHLTPAALSVRSPIGCARGTNAGSAWPWWDTASRTARGLRPCSIRTAFGVVHAREEAGDDHDAPLG